MKQFTFDVPMVIRVYKKTHRDLYLYISTPESEGENKPALLFFNILSERILLPQNM